MSDMKKMTLTFGENYNFDNDCEMVMENLKQHLVEEVGSKYPEVLDDVAYNYEAILPQIMAMSEGFDESDIQIIPHALCIAGMCIRVAAYCAIKAEIDCDEKEDNANE